MSRTLEIAAAAALACAVVSAAFGQQEPSAPATPVTEPVEEIVVTEQSPRHLRVELENAEIAFYEQFNALNSNDEFDIHCQSQVPTGRRVPERVCQPNYFFEAQNVAAASRTRGIQGSATAGNSQGLVGATHAKGQQLEAEIQKLTREHPELAEALIRLVNAQEAYQASQ